MFLRRFWIKLERKVIVAAIIIDDDGKVLTCQRKFNDSRGGGWEFPGGKLEFEETPEDALKREIQEELASEVEILDIFSAVQYAYSDTVVFIVFYLAKLLTRKEDMKLYAHAQIKWVREEELDKVEFLPADLPVVPKLKEELKRWKKS
jgi:8-oxo-dGTP diphosphatase